MNRGILFYLFFLSISIRPDEVDFGPMNFLTNKVVLNSTKHHNSCITYLHSIFIDSAQPEIKTARKMERNNDEKYTKK